MELIGCETKRVACLVLIAVRGLLERTFDSDPTSPTIRSLKL